MSRSTTYRTPHHLTPCRVDVSLEDHSGREDNSRRESGVTLVGAGSSADHMHSSAPTPSSLPHRHTPADGCECGAHTRRSPLVHSSTTVGTGVRSGQRVELLRSSGKESARYAPRASHTGGNGDGAANDDGDGGDANDDGDDCDGDGDDDDVHGCEEVVPSLWIPWCGFLINTVTMETRVNCTRYCGGYINDTITSDSSHPGQALREKLLFFIKPKCHPIYLDAVINSQFTIGLNIYHVMMLAAMKFHCFVRTFPPSGRVSTNPGFFFSVVVSLSVGYYHCASIKCVERGNVCLSFVSADVAWLTMHAFNTVLRRKQTEYRPLVWLWVCVMGVSDGCE